MGASLWVEPCGYHAVMSCAGMSPCVRRYIVLYM
ncbi:Uncharacterised protein [uncultured archaeon]|nr:Uncharacterised protein [uncultured archaeon]